MGDHRRARRQRTACWNDILRSVKSCEPESSTVRRAKSSSLCRSIKAFRRASACSSENCRGPVTMGTPLTTEKYMVWDGLEIKPHLGGHWEHTQPSVTDQLELSNALTSTQCCPLAVSSPRGAGQTHQVQADLTSWYNTGTSWCRAARAHGVVEILFSTASGPVSTTLRSRSGAAFCCWLGRCLVRTGR